MGATWKRRKVHRTSNGTLQVLQSIHLHNKSRTNIRHSRTPPQNMSYATDGFHGCNLSCRTRYNLCTIESITCNPFSKIRLWTQVSIEDPSRYIQKSKPTSITSEGASQGGRPKETPRSEPGRNPNEECTTIKSNHKCRTF